jgi:hypothetical protein
VGAAAVLYNRIKGITSARSGPAPG